MKLNWGASIVLAIGCFIGFIMFFVVQMLSSSNNQDLVTENYYHKELLVQDEIDKVNNSADLVGDFHLEKTKEGLLIHFPTSIEADKVEGEVLMYRPSDKQKDFRFPIQLKNHQLLIPAQFLEQGRWNVMVDFKIDEKAFAYKKEMTW
ncbi:FixH family protein [Psychroflexus planctonicus]|uniref:Cytochrome Cbb3 oxidase maturation protein CcoH n=1 Tax=Psychroflexus planctonicus TaxID=1526575 RepID=A0ABQ1SJ98_9FLAO|nr:FixH family protein [Psychroflexus planctonicus]GGE42820.1 cytochrome Cbb3 oxidase maturation protein CcoH [Psychroflexus planctonicus]